MHKTFQSYNLGREVIFKIHLKIIASKIQHFILFVKFFIKKLNVFRLSSVLIKASKIVQNHLKLFFTINDKYNQLKYIKKQQFSQVYAVTVIINSI